MAMLTPHFDSGEFDIHERVPDPYRPKLYAHATLLEAFRARSGARAAVVQSCYRSVERNEAVGGVRNSEHITADATDTVFVGVSRRALARMVLEQGASLPTWGQFIVYTDTNHAHISLPRHDGRANRMMLIAYRDDQGTRRYMPLSAATLNHLSDAPVAPGLPIPAGWGVLTALATVVVAWLWMR